VLVIVIDCSIICQADRAVRLRRVFTCADLKGGRILDYEHEHEHEHERDEEHDYDYDYDYDYEYDYEHEHEHEREHDWEHDGVALELESR